MIARVVLTVLACCTCVFAQGTITTWAGTGQSSPGADNVSRLAANLNGPYHQAIDKDGNLYFTELYYIRRIDAKTGNVTTIAGAGGRGDGGDNSSALYAQLWSVAQLVFTPAGDLLIADYGSNRVRRIETRTGIIRAYAGTGASGFSGDGGAAVNAQFNGVFGATVDREGNVYVADRSNGRIRRIDAGTGTITTFVGGGDSVGTDAIPAIRPGLIVADRTGGLIFWNNDGSLKRVDIATRAIRTFAGGGSDLMGEDIPATEARLGLIAGLAVDAGNHLYFTEMDTGRVRRIEAETGLLRTIAGGGKLADADCENLPAVMALLRSPDGLSADAGGLYVSDRRSNRIRQVSWTAPQGTVPVRISTNPSRIEIQVDGRPATTPVIFHWPPGSRHTLAAQNVGDANSRLKFLAWGNRPELSLTLDTPSTAAEFTATFELQHSLRVDVNGGEFGKVGVDQASPDGFYKHTARVLISAQPGPEALFKGFNKALQGRRNNQWLAMDRPQTLEASFEPLRKEPGIVEAVAGFAEPPEMVPATQTYLIPGWLAVDREDNIFVRASGLWRVDAQTGLAWIINPQFTTGSIAIGADGELYALGEVLFRLDRTTGEVQAFPAWDEWSASPELIATVKRGGPSSLAALPDGSFLFFLNQRDLQVVVRADPKSLTLERFAGDGTIAEPVGEPIPATDIRVELIQSLATDTEGNAFLAIRQVRPDTNTPAVHRIYRVGYKDRTVRSIAGMPVAVQATSPNLADGVDARDLFNVWFENLGVDRVGNVFFTSHDRTQVWRIDANTGKISRVAGLDRPGGGTDEGRAATDAGLRAVNSLAFDSIGRLLIADSGNARVRRIDPETGLIETVAGGQQGQDGSPRYIFAQGMTADAHGNLVYADPEADRLFRFDARAKTVSLLAGSGVRGAAGDGGSALEAELYPRYPVFDRDGNLYFIDFGTRGLRKIDRLDQTISTVTGSKSPYHDPNAGQPPYLSAPRNLGELWPRALGLDHSGNLIAAIEDNWLFRIHFDSGSMERLNGGDRHPPDHRFSDDEPAGTTSTNEVTSITTDPEGNICFASWRAVVRCLDLATQRVKFVVGGGDQMAAEGIEATKIRFHHLLLPDSQVVRSLNDIAIDSSGSIYFFAEKHGPRDRYVGGSIWKLPKGETRITRFAGLPGAAASENVPALEARIEDARWLTFSTEGHLYYASNGRLYRIRNAAPPPR